MLQAADGRGCLAPLGPQGAPQMSQNAPPGRQKREALICALPACFGQGCWRWLPTSRGSTCLSTELPGVSPSTGSEGALGRAGVGQETPRPSEGLSGSACIHSFPGPACLPACLWLPLSLHGGWQAGWKDQWWRD